MDEQFIKVLYTALGGLGVQSKEQFEQALQMLGEDGISLIYQQYQKNPQDVESIASLSAQILQQKQQTQMARMGAQLNYVNSLRGKCPEGYEVEKFLAGGCVKCAKTKATQNVSTKKDRFGQGGGVNLKYIDDMVKEGMPQSKDNKKGKFSLPKKEQNKKPEFKEKTPKGPVDSPIPRKKDPREPDIQYAEDGGIVPQHVIDYNRTQRYFQDQDDRRGFKGYSQPVEQDPQYYKQPATPQYNWGPQRHDPYQRYPQYERIPVAPYEYRVMPIPNYIPVNPGYVPVYTI